MLSDFPDGWPQLNRRPGHERSRPAATAMIHRRSRRTNIVPRPAILRPASVV
jgi:hypothetical protein